MLENLDRRIQRTYKSLISALTELLQEYEINNISIKMLCEKAQVTRQTFYLHFKDLQQFITFVSDRMLSDFRRVVHIYNEKHQKDFLDLTTHQSILQIFNHVLQHQVFYEALLVKNPTSPFARGFKKEIGDFVTRGLAFVAPNDEQLLIDRQLIIHYTTVGFFESIIWWVENNYEYTSEKMAEMLLGLATRGPYLENKPSP